MTARTDYHHARFGGEAVVFGLRLRPYALWHHERLEALFPGGPMTLSETLMACIVCRCGREAEWKRMLKRGWWRRVFLWWVGRWKRKEWKAETARFQQYRIEGLRMPGVLPRGGKSMTSPWEACMKLELLKTGFDSREIDEMPLRLAQWYWVANAEMQNRVEMVTDADREILKRAREMESAEGANRN